jgi:hypothetical protein
MTSTPRQPLDAEERELAERLAQLGASAEPSTALDARILGAARAATRMGDAATTTPTATGRSRPRRRWPVAMGVAATLVLAVGIAWQMRPVGETRQAYSEAPAAVQVVDAPSQRPPLRRLPSTEVEADVPPPAAPAMRALSPPPPPAEASGERTEAAAAADETASAEAVASNDAETSDRRRRNDTASETPSEPRLLQDAANEAEDASATAAAPSAFPATAGTASQERKAARQEMRQQAPVIVMDAPAVVQPAPPPAPQQREPATAPASAAPRESIDRIEITGNRIDRDNDGFSDQVIDDQPPATADSPLVQQAWLQRIRELIVRGRIDAARTSLGEFKRRYPRYALPNDLRAFQQGSLAQPADAVHGEGRDAAEDGTDGDEVDADDGDNGGGEAPDASLDASDEGGFER